MPERCRYGRLFARCGAEPIGVCQFCGREFCAAHGRNVSVDEQICIRPICAAKEVDLAAHLVFRDRALLRNRHSLCGIEGCMDKLSGQCSKCHGTFCDLHLSEGIETVREGIARYTRNASFCEHCRQRRKLWAKL